MSYHYLGWVPCISGHLDFGLMKPGISGGFTNKKIKDENTNRINFGYRAQKDHHARRVMLQSKVNWRDRLPTEKYDGSFRVFVLAEAPESPCMDNRELRGGFYVYPVTEQEESKKENYDKIWFKEIHKAQGIYDRSNGRLDEWTQTCEELNQCFENLRLALDTEGFWRVDFRVTCGGLVFLSSPTESYKLLSDQEKYLITRQAYYYSVS